MAYPISDDVLIQKLVDIVSHLIQESKVEFSIEGTDIFYQEVAGHFGCLNLLLLETQENYEKIVNQNFSTKDFDDIGLKFADSNNEIQGLKKINSKIFPIVYVEDPDAYFNCSPYFDEKEFSFAIIAHFTHYTVDELIQYYKKNQHLLKDGKIPLDNLYNKWKKALENDKIVLVEKEKLQKKKKEGINN